MNAAGIALVKSFEGFRAKAYQDMVGVWTIGYGETRNVMHGDVTTEPEASAHLEVRLAEFEQGVDTLCSHAPTENQSSAMTALAYNIGLGAFGRSTVLRKHNAGDFQGAADAFLMWCKAGGDTVPGLQRRRAAERALYLKD